MDKKPAPWREVFIGMRVCLKSNFETDDGCKLTELHGMTGVIIGDENGLEKDEIMIKLDSVVGDVNRVKLQMTMFEILPHQPPAPQPLLNTALILAVRQHINSDIIRALLDAGANPDARDSEGNTALMLAVMLRPNNFDLIHALLDAGANPNARDSNRRNALMIWLRTQDLRDYNDMCHYRHCYQLLNKTDVHWRDIKGVTALMYAVEQGNTDIVNKLISKGANPNVKDEQGMSALTRAKAKRQKKEKQKFEEILIKAGALW
jgi:hypothetical protein